MKMPEFFGKKTTPPAEEMIIFSGENDNGNLVSPQTSENSGFTLFPAESGNENPTQQNENVTVLSDSTFDNKKGFDDSSPSDEDEVDYPFENVLNGPATLHKLYLERAEAALVIAKANGDMARIKALEQDIAYFKAILRLMEKHGNVPAKFETDADLAEVHQEIERLESLPERNSTDSHTLKVLSEMYSEHFLKKISSKNYVPEMFYTPYQLRCIDQEIQRLESVPEINSTEKFTLLILTKLYNEKAINQPHKLGINPDFPIGGPDAILLGLKALMREAEAKGQTEVLERLKLEVERLLQQNIAQKQKPPKLADVTMDELTLVEKD